MANIAVQIPKSANPDKMIKLATEEFNVRAQKLYISIGFKKVQELDGDDFVFGL